MYGVFTTSNFVVQNNIGNFACDHFQSSIHRYTHSHIQSSQPIRHATAIRGVYHSQMDVVCDKTNYPFKQYYGISLNEQPFFQMIQQCEWKVVWISVIVVVTLIMIVTIAMMIVTLSTEVDEKIATMRWYDIIVVYTMHIFLQQVIHENMFTINRRQSHTNTAMYIH